MSEPTLCSIVRELIEKARTTGSRLDLTEIASAADVNYQRLWRFTAGRTDTLPADEAQRIYQALSGKTLFNDAHDSNK